MMYRSTCGVAATMLSCFLLVTAIAGLMAMVETAPAGAQDIPRVVASIQQGNTDVNSRVEIYGRIDKWRPDPSANTWAYELRDDWGDVITVITVEGLPPTEARYRVTGILNYDSARREYTIAELTRDVHGSQSGPGQPPVDPRQGQFDMLLSQAQGMISGDRHKAAIPVLQQAVTLGESMSPTPAGLSVARTMLQQAEEQAARPGPLLYILIAGVVVVGVMLYWVLRRKPAEGTADFGPGAVITVSDKTQKITAAVPTEEAIQAGTVKVMPGRFEVKGGVDLKEIRLIRPRGVSDHQIEYTFGRLTGDRIRHIQLNDPTVSSQQGRLKYGKDGYAFINIPDPEDPDRNASQINGVPLKSHESRILKDGDTLRMGNVELIYRVQ